MGPKMNYEWTRTQNIKRTIQSNTILYNPILKCYTVIYTILYYTTTSTSFFSATTTTISTTIIIF